MITTVIIVITVLISLRAFSDDALMSRFIFNPPRVERGEWHRLFTYGLVHADFAHLIFNMFTFYLFGTEVERVCKMALGETVGAITFVALYSTAILVSIIPTYRKHKNNTMYYGLGASGAVCAVIFAYVLVNPMNFMGILFIPIMLPAFLFGIVFLLISLSLDKQQAGGINHSAHIWGGVYGILFMTVIFWAFIDVNLLQTFVAQIQVNSLSDIIHIGF